MDVGDGIFGLGLTYPEPYVPFTPQVRVLSCTDTYIYIYICICICI